MKTTTILFIVGLIVSPIIGLAQTSDTQVVPPSTKVGCMAIGCPSPEILPIPIPREIPIIPREINKNLCGDGLCQEIACMAIGCPSPETPQNCPQDCQKTEIPKSLPTPGPIFVCYMNDNLMQEYNRFILELQKAKSDKVRTEEITQKIIALKQEIEKQRKKCANAPQPKPATVLQPTLLVPPIAMENKPVAVLIDRCNEVAQWENKISYYKKLSGLSDADLKKEGFSREEIEKILQDLLLGLEKVKAQCSNQGETVASPPTALLRMLPLITESVKPVVVESGQEISVYYKTKLEEAASAKGAENQIEELKTLRDEIDGLISNLIKSRKELEVSELNTLVKEVKISRGEIKADDIVVKTTEKKMLVNVGDRSISIEPTASQVLIRDKGLEVKADEVTIKENVLSVGGTEVKMSASEVTEKLGLAPKTIELKEENAKVVYNMKIEERRKLFWFIPFNIQKTIATDAESGQVLAEHLPWYSFLTTK